MGGGSQREEVIMPEFAETSMQQGLGMARDLAPLQDTYTPLYGPQVAALSPMEQAGIQGTDMMAGAFGMPTAGAQSYLPQAQTFEGGIQGYSARPMVEGMIDQFKAERPGQAEYRESFGLDPVTGEVGSRAPENQPVELEMQGGGGGK